MMEQIVRSAKREGSYDLGVMELTGAKVYLESPGTCVYKDSYGAETIHYDIKVDRGISWDSSQLLFENIVDGLIEVYRDNKEKKHNIKKIEGKSNKETKHLDEVEDLDIDKDTCKDTVVTDGGDLGKASWLKRHSRREIVVGYYKTKKSFQGKYFVLLAAEKPAIHKVYKYIVLLLYFKYLCYRK